MPLAPHQWRKLIRDTLDRISDEEYQRLAWFNQHTEASSPDELINQLVHDYNFKAFIVSDEIGLTPSQRAVAKGLSEQLSRFCEETPASLDPETTINDRRWDEIRRAAALLRINLFPG
jgi:hypothetical protein